jgi:hypothetical protein
MVQPLQYVWQPPRFFDTTASPAWRTRYSILRGVSLLRATAPCTGAELTGLSAWIHPRCSPPCTVSSVSRHHVIPGVVVRFILLRKTYSHSSSLSKRVSASDMHRAISSTNCRSRLPLPTGLPLKTSAFAILRSVRSVTRTKRLLSQKK